jgi:hypothetical protein
MAPPHKISPILSDLDPLVELLRPCNEEHRSDQQRPLAGLPCQATSVPGDIPSGDQHTLQIQGGSDYIREYNAARWHGDAHTVEILPVTNSLMCDPI